MSNFVRALVLCLRRPWTLAAALFCSLVIAGFWGANIGAVYPLMEVLFRGHSLSEWVEEEIAACRETMAAADARIAEIERQMPTLPPDAAAQAHDEIERLRQRRRAEANALWLRERLHPLAERMPPGELATLTLIVAALLAGTLVKNFFLMANAVLVERAVGLATTDLRRQFFNNALRLDLAALGETGAAELTSRFAYDMNTLLVALRNVFSRATVEPLKMTVCLIGAGLFGWRLLVLSLLLAPIAAFLIQKLAKAIKRANRRAMEEMSRLVSRLSESIEAVQIVKAFTMEQYERARFGERATAFYRKSMKIVFYNSLTKPVTETFGVGVISLALLAGGFLVLSQETHLLGIRVTDRPLSPEAFFAFFAMLAGAADPARKLADIYNLVQPGWPAADRVFDIVDRASAIQDPPRPKPVARPHRTLTFEDVSFRYGDGPMILQDIGLEIPFGQSLAIVGPNGCGKSTLVSLALRFHDPVAGTVRLDDVDLRDMRLEDLRSRIGLVSQQTQLFDDTIANNIRYGSLHASDQQVEDAARRAHAHRFIVEQLDDGYRTQVGARGGRLSGGQRQRIALARAILRNPEILILDEATSQVDLESEQLVHQVLRDFNRGRTVIMITHRLSTLALADRILVMEAGRVLDIGTHEQLLARCPLFQRLCAIELRQSA